MNTNTSNSEFQSKIQLHQQGLKELVDLTKKSKTINFSKSAIKIFIQFSFWVLGTALIICALLLPTHIINYDDPNFSLTIKNQDLAILMFIFKIALFIVGLGFIAIGFLVKRSRKKDSKAREVTERINKVYLDFLSTFN